MGDDYPKLSDRFWFSGFPVLVSTFPPLSNVKLCNSTIATAKDENRKKYLQVQKAEGRTIMPLRRDRDRSNDAAEPEWAPKKKEFHNKSDAGAPTPGRRDGLVIKIFE